MTRSAMAHLPQVTGSGESTDPTELESIYYRIVRNPEESCIEYIYYWNFQLTPTHSYDYEPIYVYLRDGLVKRVAFDLWHYKTRVMANCISFHDLWTLAQLSIDRGFAFADRETPNSTR